MSTYVQFDDTPLSIPPGTPVLETLEIGLDFMEKQVDRALAHWYESEVEGLLALLAELPLQDKLRILFPEGHDETDPEDLDQHVWPSLVSLTCLRERITPDDETAMAQQWLVDDGWYPAAMNPEESPAEGDLPELSPLTAEVWFARTVMFIANYVLYWTLAFMENPDSGLEEEESRPEE